MERHGRCPSCGALVLPDEKFCRQCGAHLQFPVTAAPAADDQTWQPGTVPTTIAQLQQFCAYNEMPLERMRFFLNQDYRQPRAFGIYEADGQYVVYKNKADGSRAVRYHGPDEAFAVHEIYAKLLDECHQRDIWPDGKPETAAGPRRRAKRKQPLIITMISVLCIVVALGMFVYQWRSHAHDGYYRFDDDLFYCYGGDWYYDDPYYDWVERDPAYYDDYSEYYMGASYDSDWGYSDFRASDAWEDIREQEHTSSSDYDSWDSGGTDWDSDW